MLQQLKTSKQQRDSKYLVLRVHFLLDRYHGNEYPPSPRKLFLALVSALYQSPSWRIDEDAGAEALSFLEKLEAPTIHAPYHKGCEYTIYVPDNDQDLISKDYAKKRESTNEPSKLTSGKPMSPYIVSTIQYTWRIRTDKESDKNAKVLCQLVKEMPVLGLGIDPVSAYGIISDSMPNLKDADQYILDESSGSTRIQVPLEGFLDDAKRHHSEFLDRIRGKEFYQPVPMTKYGEYRYRKERPVTKLHTFKITNVSNRLQLMPSNSIPNIIKKFRNGAGLKEGFSIKITAIPSIGNKYADGKVRRLGVIVPANDAQKDIHGTLRVKTISVDGNDYAIESVKNADKVHEFYCQPSRLWRTVTPVELGLSDKSPRKEIAQKILELLHDEGIDEHVAFINFRKEPYWSGLSKVPSMNTMMHVELEFKSSVRGPFVIGQNQDNGNGLFAPAQVPNIAHFTILGTRPTIEKVVHVADLMRKSVMSRIGNKIGSNHIPAYISGHDYKGNPLRENHKQAFWLPIDSDHDGFIDNIIVFAPEGFERTIHDLFYGIRELNDKHDLDLNISFRGFYDRKSIEKKFSMFGKHREWRSTTPYFMPWHEKKKFGYDEQIKKECKKRNFKECDVESGGKVGERVIPNVRFHSKHGSSRPINPKGNALKLTFKEPVTGPVALGFGAHFGLGMFVPNTESSTERPNQK